MVRGHCSKYLVALIICLCMVSCSNNSNHLSDKEKRWYAGCKAMEDAKFINLSGEIQELGYRDKGVSDMSWLERISWNINVGSEYNPNVRIYYLFEPFRTQHEIRISGSTKAVKRKHGSILSLRLGARVYECPLDSVKLKPFLINGNRYDDCVDVDENNSFYSEYAKRDLDFVSRYIWSKEHGLVYFKLKDGTIYFREDLQ